MRRRRRAQPPSGCWWDLVYAALQPDCIEGTADDDGGKVWRYPGAGRRRKGEAAKASTAPRPHDDVPSWLGRDAQAEAAMVLPLSPSHAYDRR